MLKKIIFKEVLLTAVAVLVILAVLSLSTAASALEDRNGLYDPSDGVFHLQGEEPFRFGPRNSSWQPVAGDWNGDGANSVGLYDPADGVFHLQGKNPFRFGPRNSNWHPVTGDWNGDGTASIGLYDPADGVFHLQGEDPFRFGPRNSNWHPVAGDWNGNNTSSVGLYDPTDGVFHLQNTNPFRHGPRNSSWQPVAGDWDGDNAASVGLYDPNDGVFHLLGKDPFRFGPRASRWLPLSGQWLEDSGFGTLAFEHLRALEIIGPRVAGTTQEQQAAEYISSVFKEIGYAPSTQQFPAWDEDDVSYQSANIIATKAGNSTVEIIVGAHYDSVDLGRGVDDNASGVGVMLEVAELVFSLETPYTIRFIAFGSEENDLDGSYYFVDQLSPAELKNIIAMVNLDSLVAGDVAYVYSDEGPNAFLRDWVLNWSADYNFPLKTIRNVDLSDDGWPTADYGPFQEEGIAFAYFEATNWALGDRDGYTQVDPNYGEDGHIWHTKYDNSNYLEKTFPGRISMRLAGFSAALYAICTEFTR